MAAGAGSTPAGPRPVAELTGRQAQAADRRPCRGFALAGSRFAHQRGVFVDAPDQAVTHGDRLTGAERHQPAAAMDAGTVLDEGSVAVNADAVDVLQQFAGTPWQVVLDVAAQLAQAHAALLEEVVVLDIRVVERQHRLQVAVLPAQVVAHDGGAGAFGLRGVVGKIAIVHGGSADSMSAQLALFLSRRTGECRAAGPGPPRGSCRRCCGRCG